MLITRLIPNMTFTCPGRIVRWRAAGELQRRFLSNGNTMLTIWREVNDQAGSYSRTELTIDLGTCGENESARTVTTNVYECELTSNLQVPVQEGDIIGLEIPRGNRRVFMPYFSTRDGPANYEFSSMPSTVSLSCLLYTSPSPRDATLSRMPSSA